MEEQNKSLRETQKVLDLAQQKYNQQAQQPEGVNSLQISEMGIILNSKTDNLREIIVLCKTMLKDKVFKKYLNQLKKQSKKKVGGYVG